MEEKTLIERLRKYSTPELCDGMKKLGSWIMALNPW